MENKRIKVLDGIIEVSLRTLCILYAVQCPISKDRISAYDYFTQYTKDISPKYDNLSTEIKSYSTSYIGEIQALPYALNILLSRNLIQTNVNTHQLMYDITELGCSVVKLLGSNGYTNLLFQHINQVKEFFSCYSDSDINAFIKTHISNWNIENSKI